MIRVLKYGLLVLIQVLLFQSCSKDDGGDSDTTSEEVPEPIEEYFFRGTLGDEVLDITSAKYDSSVLNPPLLDSYIIEYGGGGTDSFLNSQDIEHCFGDYSLGIRPTIGPDANLPTAKIYFRDIYLGPCSIENEKLGIEAAFDENEFVYTEFLGDETEKRLSLYYYPPNVESIPINELDFYFSIGENSNSEFEITSITEESSDIYIIEGNFACRMYSHLDDTKFKDLKDGTFRIRIKTNF